MSTRELLRVGARWSRQLASAGLLLLTCRFAWLGGQEVMDADRTVRRTSPVPAEDQADPIGSKGRHMVGEMEDSVNKARPDLDELRKMIGVGEDGKGNPGGVLKPGGPDGDKEDGPQLTTRRLVVDMGPERAAVFVKGRRVGKVPYVGMVQCVDGERIRVQVLPPKGLPLEEWPMCGDLPPSEEK